MAFSLTSEQQAAVDNRGGGLLVSAAAGSGKTRVLVERLLARVEGEGLDIACLGFVESALLVHNWGTLAQQGRSGGFGGVVSLPRPLTGHKSPYRAEFGFGLLAGDSEKDHPPFQQSRVSNRAEEKNIPALLLKIRPG